MTRLLALVLLAAILASCEETGEGITVPCGFGQPCAVDPVASLAISVPAQALVPGDTVTVSAIARDSAGAPIAAAIVYGSADSTVAIVDANGLLTAIGPGTTSITAAVDSHEATVDVDVVALIAAGVSAGEDVTCATTNVTGRTQCWGLGDAGQLGVEPDTACFADDIAIGDALGCAIGPRVVRRDLALAGISSGDSLTCALGDDGAAWCWGDNRFGQLGVGSVASGDGPQRVTALAGAFTMISAGGRHACGIAASTTYCWGEDSLGQLGDARRINSTTPIPVVTTQFFASVATGLRHTCALNAGGEAYCWGNNESGQLGTGSVGGSADVPAAVLGGHSYTAIAAGDSSTCALRTDGAVLCWGADTWGQLGRGTMGGSSGSPAPVAGGLTFIAVDVGSGYACAVAPAGDAHCWGKNDYGQLGSAGGGTAMPRAVDGGIAFATLSAGARHACGVTGQGAVYCWGSNVFGALGNRLQAAARGMPVPVPLSP